MPDDDVLEKLSQVLKYLRATRDLPLSLEAEGQGEWWIDASYGILHDMKSHPWDNLIGKRRCISYLRKTKDEY